MGGLENAIRNGMVEGGAARTSECDGQSHDVGWRLHAPPSAANASEHWHGPTIPQHLFLYQMGSTLKAISSD